MKRGISEDLIGELTSGGILLHNRHKGKSYCCFAVHDGKGELQCLDNHQVDGPSKFVLGRKSVFTLDWEVLSTTENVFISEGIIDYLSIKTLEGERLPGLALLGNDVRPVPSLLGKVTQILSAFDDDRGGLSGYLDLLEEFPDAQIKAYDLEGHKDPNDLLKSIRAGKGRKLSAARKLKLYQEFLKTSNRTELARKWGIDRSYMYEIARECEETLLDTFSDRKPGHKPEGKPKTLEEAWERINALENQYEREATERELLYCRSEFLNLRLKWSEREVAELRGERVNDTDGLLKKKHAKKRKARDNRVTGSCEGRL
ncbi:MAG: toprim domain-containing protein [Thermodesulfobacteriota bacterium]|nr:toprim domain-containing protein [Thermodesulfobacteriota bacterium]